ncbi:MAG: aldolase/citrate lyase family protein [Pseudomonadota bacterium]
MGFADFRSRMQSGERLVGTFIKVPAYETIEYLHDTGLDFICLDAEHSPFDRARMDACLAVARALDFPTLVRVSSGSVENVLMALDSGALGIVCPHIDTVEKAEALARSARFGEGGRGFAGSTRWAGLTRRTMPEILSQSQNETVVIAQIEEPEGVEASAEIAAVPGIDGLFVGPADLTVAYGETALWSDQLMQAYAKVGAACAAAGVANITFVPGPAEAERVAAHGVNVFFVSSEAGWMAAGARAAATAIKAP